MPDARVHSAGIDSAAILLMTLGEEQAAEVLKHMEPKEVQRVGAAMARLANVTKERVTQVLSGFMQEVDNQTALGIGTEDYVRKTLVKAIGVDKADGVIDRILHNENTKGLESLKWMEPRAVAELIRVEHPQIIAIVLAYLESEHAAQVLAHLPDGNRTDVMMRVASLDGIPPSALTELNEVMEKQFMGKANVKSANLGGVKTAANILNFLDSSIEATLLEKLKENDEALVNQIEELMFVFDDLTEIDDRGMQAVLREISSESLLIALKGASDGVKDKIFKNMSKRVGEMLSDDLDAKGPVRISEVEKAQKEILSVVRRMAETGEITLGGKQGEAEDYV